VQLSHDVGMTAVTGEFVNLVNDHPLEGYVPPALRPPWHAPPRIVR
jgi:hypothetical protein